MGKFIINHELEGYNTVEINNVDLPKEQSDVILVLSSEDGINKTEYYNAVLEMLVSGTKLITVIVGQGSNLSKSISRLMATYRNYNIYSVIDKDIIDNEFTENVMGREPSYNEVQTFIGGDVSGYADINSIILGIKSLVSDGDTDGIKTFISNHINSIEAFPDVINYMKKVVDVTNSGELLTKIDELVIESESLRVKLKEYEDKISNLMGIKNKLEESIVGVKEELVEYKKRLAELSNQGQESGFVIKSYSELNTSIVKCKVENVLYFKEVSYVNYTKSLIHSLVEAMKAKGLNVKVLIYDNASSLSSIYKPAPVIGGADYTANKSTFIKSTERIVVVEPTVMIIEDMLTSISPKFDVVVVYDRLKQSNDIVIGNNVHKYFVINSYKDYLESKSTLKITDSSYVITSQGGTLQTGVLHKDGRAERINVPKERLDIPKIMDYNNLTDTAKVAKYMKLPVSSGNSTPIIASIFGRLKI